MRADFDKWWLLPSSLLAALVLVALGIIVFGPPSVGRSFDAVVAQRAANEPTVDCSGALSNDYACHRERYQDLVFDSGVEAAFAHLRDDYGKNDFVKYNCHRLTHDIGHAADRYGDISGAFGHGEHFCVSGYYHGVMETIVAKIGADEVLEEPDAICADLREHQEYSDQHYGCAHGLGHGFMALLDNELFESLAACDRLTDGWEREHCYSGVFRENVQAKDDPNHPSKYLKADQNLYSCTDVEDRYKNPCYRRQPMYALWTQDNDFAKVFDLCAKVEGDFRPACYHGLGRSAFFQSIEQQVTDVAQAGSTRILCMLGEDQEAQSNCIAGAVKTFIFYNRGDTARDEAFCGPFEADLGAACGRAAEEYYEDFALD